MIYSENPTNCPIPYDLMTMSQWAIYNPINTYKTYKYYLIIQFLKVLKNDKELLPNPINGGF